MQKLQKVKVKNFFVINLYTLLEIDLDLSLVQMNVL